MLTSDKIIAKLWHVVNVYGQLRFERVAAFEVEMVETLDRRTSEPQDLAWAPAPIGTRWGGNFVTAWFRGRVAIPDACAGRRTFLHFPGGRETMLFVDGVPRGVFDSNHHHVLLAADGEAGRAYHVAFEAYSGQSFPDVMPRDKPVIIPEKGRTFEGAWVTLEREDVSAFVFDLRTLLGLHKALDEHAMRRAEIQRALQDVHTAIRAFPDEHDEADWRPRLARAREVMRPLLARKNSATVMDMRIVAHSHIDTAWLWPVAETRRKCARTFSSMVNLLGQYPEVIFLQSAPCHAEFVREDYPELFRHVQAMVAAGRWEPNGGCWIEPDCNLTGGEALVRQFLVGIRWTRKHYNGYSSDTLWQPDVFGYSAALPQILQGCGIKYFYTTKMSWNDTTRFPYDTFVWRGIDGTSVVTHLNSLPQQLDPEFVMDQWRWSQHKDGEFGRLLSYGHGDGGGGPRHEDMELARRMEDLEGLPRVKHSTISAFMQEIEERLPKLPVWVGELYLELHRGTLTSIAPIKRGNRLGEIALRDAEALASMAALAGKADYPRERFDALWRVLLTNQFHDILPGTSVKEANDVAIRELQETVASAREVARNSLAALAGTSNGNTVDRMVFNSLSWTRVSEIELAGIEEGWRPADERMLAQRITTLDGEERVVLLGQSLPPMGASLVRFERGNMGGGSPFHLKDDTLQTPHATIRFDQAGRIVSCVMKGADRDIVRPGGALNTLWVGEDVPLVWDNWDIDSEQELFMRAETRLVSREVVADGPLQFRLRSEYRIGERSTLRQDMVFHAMTPRIDFETRVEWNEKHVLLKAGFELDILADTARHEIQYGHAERATHRNYPNDRARFEVCAHKWTDLSENGFGVALLNDCKYGVSVHHSDVRLSLLKSGTHPDPRGDAGHHVFKYALLPHDGGFSVENVVRPAYEFNIAPVAVPAPHDAQGLASLLTVDAANVIVESVKLAEDGKDLVVRLYEASRCGTHARIEFGSAVKWVEETNMLEENGRRLELETGAVRVTFRPFEIKTLKVGG
jgi:alpha-mannosidase